MNAWRGRKRLFITLAIVLVLLAVGTIGILKVTSVGKPGSDPAVAERSEEGARSSAADESVALASNKTQTSGAADAGGGDDGKARNEDEDGKDQKGDKKDKKEKSPVPVSITEIGTGAISSYLSSTANLVPEGEVEVLAEAEGRVTELDVEEGDRVRRGQMLASLARGDAEMALKKAQLKATNARLAYERAEKMVGEELMSREEYDRITMEHEIAEQEAAEAQWQLEKTMIRAPFSGRLTQRNVVLGQHIRPGDVLFTVSDFDPLIARIYLPEKDVLGLLEGRQVRITLKADMMTRFVGRIRQISPVVDTSTGTVKLTIEAINPPPQVRPGAFVGIDIVRETRTAAVLVPREAIVRELQDAFVFVANGDVAEKRPVSLGLEENGSVEAVSGISPGDQVIVAGQGGLRDGSPIKVVPTSEASGLYGTPPDRPLRG